ncbi:MAG: CHAD domain-containing protein [Cryobacterium sp.]|nr:CHAD domain-containing protein [Oligoflexia bacterium]
MKSKRVSQSRTFLSPEIQAETISTLMQRLEKKTTRNGVHQLRVAVRRSRTAIWLIENSSVCIRFRPLDRKLKKLASHLGELRELDVVVRDAEKFDLHSGKLERLLSRTRKKFQKFMQKKGSKRLITDLFSTDEEIKGLAGLDYGVAMEKLREKLALYSGDEGVMPVDFHDFRKALKKTRYSLEALAIPATPLISLIDVLGKWHDLCSLEAAFSKSKAIRHAKRNLQHQATELFAPVLAFAEVELAKG